MSLYFCILRGGSVTRLQFIDLWKCHLTGLALTGLVDSTDEAPKGPFDAGKKALALPPKIEKLLGSMYDSASAVPKEAK